MKIMKLKKGFIRKSAVAGAIMCTAAVLVGCGSAAYDTAVSVSSGAADAELNYEEEYGTLEATEAMYDNGSITESGETQVNDTSRKLIKNVSMEVETKEFDIMLKAVQDKVEELGGYIEELDVYNGSVYSSYRSSKNASLTARIPQSMLEEFLNCVSEAGNVTNRSDSIEDITLTYVDTESRREALSTEQERLLVLLEEAESIDDIIAIESRLSEVRYQLESIESKLRTYDNQVDYSTVYMSISEVRELTPVEERSILERMGSGFVESLKSIGNGIVEFAVWLVIHIPYIIIWAAVIVFFVIILRLIKKRTGRIKEEKNKKANNEKE